MTGGDMADYIALTEPLPSGEAEAAFLAALAARGLRREDLDPDRDIIVDTFRSHDGILRRRYRVRRALLQTTNPPRALRIHGVVVVAQLPHTPRGFTGTEGVARPPRIGDRAAVVHVYDESDDSAPVALECVDAEGRTLWLSDFLPHEVRAE